ncbi:hypothetical protein [Fodinibius sp.]|uniref:hypothetical protein n=1 Tax=Fodinibius sp. TaxID=1872440 RepID=UPI002ACDEDD0|nr:hypothetical protein [Fodinibius sp.]MDZ7659641.1 hypothetical protein [Fodinibius sp.]
MKRYSTTILLLVLFPILLLAQQKTENERNQSPSFRINAYPIEVEMELAISKSISVMNAAGFNLFEEGISGIDILKDSNPYIQVFPRYYYNLDKRSKENKTISGFSGNYIGLYTLLDLQGVGEPNYINNQNEFWIGPTWGIQRKISDVAHLDLFLGYGLGWYLDEPFFSGMPSSPLIGLKVGIYLN